jgi:pimeloyl-ACP methyl ester carboxylesterase
LGRERYEVSIGGLPAGSQQGVGHEERHLESPRQLIWINVGWPRCTLKRGCHLDRFVWMLETAQGDFPSREAGAANDTRQFTTLKLGMTDGIEAPTLFVHGTADTNAPFAGVRETASRLPRAETIWLEGGDHLISISRPEEIRPG